MVAFGVWWSSVKNPACSAPPARAGAACYAETEQRWSAGPASCRQGSQRVRDKHTETCGFTSSPPSCGILTQLWTAMQWCIQMQQKQSFGNVAAVVCAQVWRFANDIYRFGVNIITQTSPNCACDKDTTPAHAKPRLATNRSFGTCVARCWPWHVRRQGRPHRSGRPWSST